MYGTKIEAGQWSGEGFQPSVIGEVECSNSGNVILRVGRQNMDAPGWHQTEHVVLTPDEARALAEELLSRL